MKLLCTGIVYVSNFFKFAILVVLALLVFPGIIWPLILVASIIDQTYSVVEDDHDFDWKEVGVIFGATIIATIVWSIIFYLFEA